jgi:hypothetical protein
MTYFLSQIAYYMNYGNDTNKSPNTIQQGVELKHKNCTRVFNFDVFIFRIRGFRLCRIWGACPQIIGMMVNTNKISMFNDIYS